MTHFKSLLLRIELFRARRQLREPHQAHMEAYRAHQNLVSSKEVGEELDQAAEKSRQTAEVSVAKEREVEGLQAQIDEIRSARLVRKLLRRGLDLPDSQWYKSVQAP